MPSSQDEFASELAIVTAAVRAQVEHQATLGVVGFVRDGGRGRVDAGATAAGATSGGAGAASASSMRVVERADVVESAAATAPTVPVPSDAGETARAAPANAGAFLPPGVAAADTLDGLCAAIGDCRRCKLAPGRTNLVFGVGNPKARLVFVGEGPGRDEDLQGEPFVGRAGQLLTEIITKGMGIRRADVYICNVVKCRPPENRNPEPDEVEACEPFLQRQLELIGPEVIVALGKFAAQTLLRSKTPITKLRGQWFDYHGIKLLPTFHPAYLLRNPGEKRLVWQDIQQVMQVLGLPLPQR